METSEVEIEYFLEVNGQKRGPFRLSGLIDAGMQPDSMIWWEGLESWARAGKIPKFAALMKQDRLERIAARRAERLPEPGKVRRLGHICLMAMLPAAVVCLVGSTVLWASLIICLLIANAEGPPAAGPSEGLVTTGTVLFFAGVLGSVLGLASFIAVAVFVFRFALKCRDIVRAAAPSHRDEKVDLSGLAQELGNESIGGPSLPQIPDLTAVDLLELSLWSMLPYGRYGLMRWGAKKGVGLEILMLGPLSFTLILALALPIFVCLVKPDFIVQIFGITVTAGVYFALHLPIVVLLLWLTYRPGLALNHVKDLYQLKVPWAPVGLAFWTAICGMLLLAGPFSIVFFILLAIWARSISETAAQICGEDSRQRIATPLPEEAPTKKAAADYDL
jgi:hypothetical protein